MVTEDTILNFGKYKHSKLKIKDIPVDYLIEFYRSTNRAGCTGELKEILEYINVNHMPQPQLKKRPLDSAIDLVLNMCPKEVFVSEGDAKYRLKYINSFKNDHKTPSRAYQCNFCGYWHLTSQENHKYLKKTKQTTTNVIMPTSSYRSKFSDAWAKLMKEE
jgi:uncharacterized protein (DUF3820 family)